MQATPRSDVSQTEILTGTDKHICTYIHTNTNTKCINHFKNVKGRKNKERKEKRNQSRTKAMQNCIIIVTNDLNHRFEEDKQTKKENFFKI